MKLVGLTMVRNEEWILKFSLSVSLQWLDELVILDHGSTDSTPDIIEQFRRDNPDRIHVLRRDDSNWPEMDLRQATLEEGRRIGGTHFAIIDGDEALIKSSLSVIRNRFSELEKNQVLFLKMIPAWRAPTQYRIDPCVWTRGRICLGWCDGDGITWKPTNGYHLHSRPPSGIKSTFNNGESVVHYQFADFSRLRWKHRWYKLHEAVMYPNKAIRVIDSQYSKALDEKNLQVKSMPAEWLWGNEHEIQIGLPTWYEKACVPLYVQARKMGRVHGLNLWKWASLK